MIAIPTLRFLRYDSRVAIAFICAFSFSVSFICFAAPDKAASPSSTKSSQPPTFQVARASLFEHLQKNTDAVATLPTFPREKLILWISQRQQSVAANEKARYLFLYEQLLVAQSLLDESDKNLRAQGLLVASESANYAAATLPKDYFLLARIYESFLLPYISLASTERWRDPSRQRLIESASSAFAQADESGKQQKMLEWLLALGEAKPNPKHPSATQLDQNTLDWTRGTLAVLLSQPTDAPVTDLQRAQALLEAIKSPTMSGFKHIQERLQKRINSLSTP